MNKLKELSDVFLLQSYESLGRAVANAEDIPLHDYALLVERLCEHEAEYAERGYRPIQLDLFKNTVPNDWLRERLKEHTRGSSLVLYAQSFLDRMRPSLWSANPTAFFIADLEDDCNVIAGAKNPTYARRMNPQNK